MTRQKCLSRRSRTSQKQTLWWKWSQFGSMTSNWKSLIWLFPRIKGTIRLGRSRISRTLRARHIGMRSSRGGHLIRPSIWTRSTSSLKGVTRAQSRLPEIYNNKKIRIVSWIMRRMCLQLTEYFQLNPSTAIVHAELNTPVWHLLIIFRRPGRMWPIRTVKIWQIKDKTCKVFG